jgi:hypothetical protein
VVDILDDEEEDILHHVEMDIRTVMKFVIEEEKLEFLQMENFSRMKISMIKNMLDIHVLLLVV